MGASEFVPVRRVQVTHPLYLSTLCTSAPFAPHLPHAPQAPAPQAPAPETPPKPVPFVCEDDVRAAVRKGEKILVGAKTIITPAARDAGEAARVFTWQSYP